MCSNPACNWLYLGFICPLLFFGPRITVCASNQAATESMDSGCLRSHSQTINTLHPATSSSLRFRSSRAIFPLILGPQYSRLVAGSTLRLQPCPCQKQPCTKITHFREGNTMSGFPGKSFRCNRNRKPRACSCRRTNSSGFVSLERTAVIVLLRCFGVSRSMAT